MHQLSHLFLPRSRRSIPFYPTAPLLAQPSFASPIHRWHGAFSCVRPTVQLSVHSAKFRNFAISTLRRGALSSNSLSHSVNSWHSVLYILYRCSNMKPRPSERERLKWNYDNQPFRPFGKTLSYDFNVFSLRTWHFRTIEHQHRQLTTMVDTDKLSNNYEYSRIRFMVPRRDQPNVEQISGLSH